VANEGELKILKEKGVKAWNQWREANPDIRPDLRGANLIRMDLGWVDLREVNLGAADLSDTDLSDAKLRGACLVGAYLRRAHLVAADLSSADLRSAFLSSADLRGVNLAKANLSNAYLNKTILIGTDLSAAILCGSYLHEADMFSADLRETDLSGAIIGYTSFANVNLIQTKGLETINHTGPSTVGIDTIYRSGGKIPEVFLRGAGVPEPFIVHMKSLVAAMSPIEFYSCFISYSSKDQEFAERLYADLQSKRVRCWFAPEDLKIGDKLRPAFDEAIRVHDKLMVLLSENSVGSPWVEKEVETAFEKEHQQNRTVLFPIRLDEAVMETDQAWAADIRRTRHIGDFRDWKNHDSYKRAFERLLRDLKAEH
jgi:uncharacterized protein YjbI with pentapeptide repeats